MPTASHIRQEGIKRLSKTLRLEISSSKLPYTCDGHLLLCVRSKEHLFFRDNHLLRMHSWYFKKSIAMSVFLFLGRDIR